jgi:hypothetical protein
MGILHALDRPYVNPFYRSQDDEEADDVAKEEYGNSPSSSPHRQETLGDSKTVVPGSEVASIGEQVDPRYQPGVQKAEGVTLAWNKRALWLTYIWYVTTFLTFLLTTS